METTELVTGTDVETTELDNNWTRTCGNTELDNVIGLELVETTELVAEIDDEIVDITELVAGVMPEDQRKQELI